MNTFKLIKMLSAIKFAMNGNNIAEIISLAQKMKDFIVKYPGFISKRGKIIDCLMSIKI